jgi:hypothetical protein
MRTPLALVLLVSLAGCGEDPPPLDELPLRDALQARPEVLAALPGPARQRLRDRLEQARASDHQSDEAAGAASERELVEAVDRSRQIRAAEPLIVGAADLRGTVRAVASASVQGALPPLEGDPPLAMEVRALAGQAAAPLRALLLESSARRLVRVVGWPIGAVAIRDTVYVDAAWLVAMAPDEVDAGAASGPSAGPDNGEAATLRTATAPPPDAGYIPPSPPGGSIGVLPPLVPPDEPPPPDDSSSCDDACAAWTASGASQSCSGDDHSDDSCSSSDQSDGCSGSGDEEGSGCSGSSEEEGSGCNQTAGESASNDCQVGRRRGRRHDPGTLAMMFLPFGYLLRRR